MRLADLPVRIIRGVNIEHREVIDAPLEQSVKSTKYSLTTRAKISAARQDALLQIIRLGGEMSAKQIIQGGGIRCAKAVLYADLRWAVERGKLSARMGEKVKGYQHLIYRVTT